MPGWQVSTQLRSHGLHHVPCWSILKRGTEVPNLLPQRTIPVERWPGKLSLLSRWQVSAWRGPEELPHLPSRLRIWHWQDSVQSLSIWDICDRRIQLMQALPVRHDC